MPGGQVGRDVFDTLRSNVTNLISQVVGGARAADEALKERMKDKESIARAKRMTKRFHSAKGAKSRLPPPSTRGVWHYDRSGNPVGFDSLPGRRP